MKLPCLLLALVSASLADRPGYGGYSRPYCRPTNTSIYAEVCVPGIASETSPVTLAVKNVADDEFCYTATKTVCREETKTIERDVCTYTYEAKKEAAPATITQVTYETKSETMKVTACRPTSYGGYNSKPHGYGGEHQVCKEEYQTQEYRVPRVDEPLEVSVDLTLPTPKQVCQKETIEYTETVCEDQEEQRCITFAKLDDASVTVDQTEAILGEPNCNKVTLSLPTEVCTKHQGYNPYH